MNYINRKNNVSIVLLLILLSISNYSFSQIELSKEERLKHEADIIKKLEIELGEYVFHVCGKNKEGFVSCITISQITSPIPKIPSSVKEFKYLENVVW
ncbi:hypothetical protein [Flammeovirga aprica]|uniref:Uncharacterized protein n=1 Tax=Flammeovirga aprica JL-4 TaxID=694437 RepID=A0A7X9RZD8_9BACT|nr:hypothetical protein [Flammeovirga aprica]NME71550.1 hypothetical protein [Flammeovirga aprica JL-4]